MFICILCFFLNLYTVNFYFVLFFIAICCFPRLFALFLKRLRIGVLRRSAELAELFPSWNWTHYSDCATAQHFQKTFRWPKALYSNASTTWILQLPLHQYHALAGSKGSAYSSSGYFVILLTATTSLEDKMRPTGTSCSVAGSSSSASASLRHLGRGQCLQLVEDHGLLLANMARCSSGLGQDFNKFKIWHVYETS